MERVNDYLIVRVIIQFLSPLYNPLHCGKYPPQRLENWESSLYKFLIVHRQVPQACPSYQVSIT